MLRVLREYQAAKRQKMLLVLPFTTVTEYLFELRTLAMEMRPLGPRALFYLAAAVSDFFIPRDRLVEHKIQSGGEGEPPASRSTPGSANTHADAHADGGNGADGGGDIAGASEQQPLPTNTGSGDPVLTQPPPQQQQQQHKQLVINLDPVPKFLTTLVSTWKPSGSTVVSFKLETDPTLLIGKSRQALRRYGHDLVIGNLLTTRKWEVVFVGRAMEREGRRGAEGIGREGRDGDDGEGEETERWIRVPRLRRGRSVSGKVDMVGLAQKATTAAVAAMTPPAGENGRDRDGGDADDTDAMHEEEDVLDLDGGKVREDMEIESLIVPALAEMHGKAIEEAAAASR